MNRSVSIIGVGRYTAVIIELAEICGYEIDALYHYDSSRNGEHYHGYTIKSSIGDLPPGEINGKNFVLSMGDNAERLNLISKLCGKGGVFPVLQHPMAEVSRTARLGKGVILGRNVCVEALATLAEGCIVCENTTICHHAILGPGCFVAANSVIGAGAKLGIRVFIGQGAVVPSGKVSEIGENSIIGAGAVVVRDVPPGVVMVGNPARILRNVADRGPS